MFQSTSKKVPPHVQVLSMIHGALVSQAVLAVAELRLANLVRDGKKSAAQLAEATQTDELNLYRLLRTLVGLGIFSEPEPGYFASTELSACLQSDSPESLYHLTLLLEGRWKTLGSLSYSLRTGKPAFEHLYGKDQWRYLAEDDPEAGALFNRAMTSISGSMNQPLVDAYDFSSVGTLVDVGGGEGSFLVAALERNPALKGVLFDQPSVIEQARERIARSGVAVGILGDLVPPVQAGLIDDGSVSGDLHAEVRMREGDILLKKPRYGAFNGTDLELILRHRGIDTLIIGGIATNVCCETTAREATVRDFKVLFLSDGTATFGLPDQGFGEISAQEVQRVTCSVMSFFCGQVLTVNQAIEKIRTRQ